MVRTRLAEKHPQLAIDTDVRIGDAAFGIEQMVAQHEAALIVMATHGRTGIGTLEGCAFARPDTPGSACGRCR